MCPFQIKGDNDPFDSIEEFVDNLSRGGEIEFIYQGKKYSITHVNGDLCFIQIGNDLSEKLFENADSLLEHMVANQHLRDIVTEIQPYFRCF